MLSQQTRLNVCDQPDICHYSPSNISITHAVILRTPLIMVGHAISSQEETISVRVFEGGGHVHDGCSRRSQASALVS